MRNQDRNFKLYRGQKLQLFRSCTQFAMKMGDPKFPQDPKKKTLETGIVKQKKNGTRKTIPQRSSFCSQQLPMRPLGDGQASHTDSLPEIIGFSQRLGEICTEIMSKGPSSTNPTGFFFVGRQGRTNVKTEIGGFKFR